MEDQRTFLHDAQAIKLQERDGVSYMNSPSLVEENHRLREENRRLWSENSTLRPLVSDLEHRLAVAMRHLKQQAKEETDAILNPNRTHG
jgi:hypothetical protein